MPNVDIKGLDKADVLATLYNASKPLGLGFLQAGGAPLDMNRDQAQSLINSYHGDLNFDYVHGRPIKVDLSGASFDPWLFDRDNGGDGTAQRIIDRLRETGDVRSEGDSFADTELSSEQALMFLIGSMRKNH